MTSGGLDAERVTAQMLADLADVPYFRVDADRNVVEVSPAMLRLTGFEAEEVLGGSCLRVHRCVECLQGCGVFEAGTVRDKRLELYTADGSTVAVSKSGGVFLDDQGEITGALEIVKPLAEAAQSAGGEPEEARRIRAALERAKYHRTEAARSLGMSRTTLWRRMRDYGL
jgi:PAS domain S-box-containing protein